MNLYSYFSLYKNELKMDHRLKTIKHLELNIGGKNLCDLVLSKEFLTITPKTRPRKENH